MGMYPLDRVAIEGHAVVRGEFFVFTKNADASFDATQVAHLALKYSVTASLVCRPD